MKIVYILPSPDMRGISTIYEQIDRLAEKGHDTLITSLDETKASKAYPLKSSLMKMEDARNEFEKADVIIGYNPVCAFFVNDLETDARKYCLLLDDERKYYTKENFKAVNRTLDSVDLENEYKRQNTSLNASYRLPIKYIVVNQKLENELKKKKAKTILSPIGVNKELFYPEQYIPKRDVIRLVTNSGTFPWEKAELVNRALTKLRAFELWTIGEKPNMKTDKHWLKPDADNLRKIFSSSDVFINMQDIDGTADATLQAMACGCAVITARTNGSEMFCKDGKNCIMIKGGTDEKKVEHLKDTIESLMNDKELLESLIMGGLETVSKMDWNVDNLEKGLKK